MARLHMTPRFPPLPWLRAFEASARHLSFTHAATELNLTQAAVSKQVKLLEHYLREPLFHRKPRSLVLSKIGAAYLPKVRDAFERIAEGTEEVFGHRRNEVLTIRSVAGFAVNWIAPRLPGFFARFPKTPIRIVSSVWNEEFDRERFDLDIRYGTGTWPGFRADRLTWEAIEPLCTPETARRLARPEDLAAERLLHVIGYEEGWAVWLRAAGARGVNAGQGIQFDTSIMAFEVAANGGGVALGRSSMSAREIASGRLMRPFDLAVPIREAFYMIAPQQGGEHPDAALFREWILGEAAAERPVDAA
jgi:LysR family glycine cleavage system transcriptional activator